MKKTSVILGIVCALFLFTGCQEGEGSVDFPPIEIPVVESESESEKKGESETEFVFSDMTVYHGVLVMEQELIPSWYLGGGIENPEAYELRESLLCSSYREYRDYIERVKLVWPDADVYKFPDIPPEWFEEWSLLTLLLIGNDIGGGFSLTESWTDGRVLLLTLEGDTREVEMKDWIVYDRGTFLTAIPKEQAEKLEIIDYVVLFDGQEEENQQILAEWEKRKSDKGDKREE